MTYCVGMLMKDGFVLAADTRTNAGLDNIAVFKKLHNWSQPGKRVFVLATSGNLATTQAVVSLLTEGTMSLAQARRASTICSPPRRCSRRRADRGPRGARRAADRRRGHFQSEDTFSASFLFAGQIGSRAAATVPDLLGREFHRGNRRHALPADR